MRRGIFLLLLALALFFGIQERRMLALRVYGWVAGGPVELLDPVDEGPRVRWFDDYYTVEWIDDTTIAIGEPRHPQAIYNYLILGGERALLFDSGPGLREIRPVVERLTSLPVTVVPSHLHYDHLGNHRSFDRVAVVDLSYLRERAPDGRLLPTEAEHLGFIEGFERYPLEVDEWLPLGEHIDLGGRELLVLHTPGHTPESIALLDEARGQLFIGDYATEGALFAFVPGSSLRDYLETAEALLARIPEGTALWTAHRMTPPGAPRLERSDLVDLHRTLLGIRDGSVEGSGILPRVFRVNDELELHTDFEWTERWD